MLWVQACILIERRGADPAWASCCEVPGKSRELQQVNHGQHPKGDVRTGLGFVLSLLSKPRLLPRGKCMQQGAGQVGKTRLQHANCLYA